MENRGSSVIIENNKVALMKRVRAGQEYYVFPGGGIEYGESPEQVAIRETFEELGVHVVITGSLGIVNYNGVQYFFIFIQQKTLTSTGGEMNAVLFYCSVGVQTPAERR